MPTLRQGQAVCGLPQFAAELRGLRARLRLHRRRRWAGDFHHHDCRRDRGRRGPDRGGEIPAAVLAARRALAAADPRDHAAAAALDEVASDRAAVPSQGRARPADRPRAEMTGVVSRRRGVTGFAIFTVLMVATCVALGVWQLQRRLEKHALISALNERLAAAPEALPAPSQWHALTPARDEFRRVSFTATYAKLPDAMIYSSGSAVREDVSGPGTWAFLPARLPDGATVVINAGFVPNTMQERAQQDRAVTPLVTGAPVTLTGYLRFPEAAGVLTPPENIAKRLWFTRDHQAMARAHGWAEAGRPVAPFYIDLEAPVPASGTPKPGSLQVHLKDDHMQYAITWFGLACAMVIAFGVWMRGQRRR